jgi:hypothetical protein
MEVRISPESTAFAVAELVDTRFSMVAFRLPVAPRALLSMAAEAISPTAWGPGGAGAVRATSIAGFAAVVSQWLAATRTPHRFSSGGFRSRFRTAHGPFLDASGLYRPL